MSDVNKLVKALAKDAKPVSSVNMGRKLVYWLITACVVSAISVILLGVRADLTNILQSTVFIIEILLALSVGGFSALAACWLATPDCKQQKWVIWLPIVPLSVGIFIILYQLVIIPLHIAQEPASIHCAANSLWLMILPAAFIFFILRMAASTHTWLSSIMALLAVSSFAYISMRLVCAAENLEHLLLWHYLPIVVFVIIGSVIAHKLLKWK